MAHTSIKQLTEQIHFLVELLTEKQLEEYLLFLESNKESRISDPIQIALILLDLQLNIEILQVTHVMD